VDFIGAKGDGVVVTTGTTRRAKLQSKRHHQQTNTSFLQAGCPSFHPSNSIRNASYLSFDVQKVRVVLFFGAVHYLGPLQKRVVSDHPV